ncbi:PAS domain S-box-containing protein [Nannocystis exedens]|uniref:PAS domain S-box-containing protein n=1 Tax=Nannocystis exedens TaxID=54 RepID=A0A1I2GYC5_9BACT|nr:PAS domain-containing protein [Nannocystis exedens]PCC68875.1 PAS/PAC and GAF sensor-containing diguanylate cyclase/phosphodiesterase [Nannocystis exedens]SFF22422.1 PAS domain S-box-containing protein [Nannocystis exedens]
MTDAAETPQAELVRLRRRVAELEAEALALRASEAELRAMFSAMTDAVLIVDRDGRYLRLPETAPGARYKPAPEFLGKTMHDVLPPGHADAFVADIRRALAEDRVVNSVYSRTIRGEELWFSANASPLTADTVVVVVREITDEVRHEQALRDNLRQQERLREHEAALLQLSTPLIPIRDDVLVMPLIGRLDATRLGHAQATLLQGVAAARARVAIVDVTGVGELDVAAAAKLSKAAQAVRLLGARVVLTGVRPEVAAALAASAGELAGITVRASLKDAVGEAIGDGPRAF